MLNPNNFKKYITICDIRCRYYGLQLYATTLLPKSRSIGSHTPKEECVFQDIDATLKAAVISVLRDSIAHVFVTMSTIKKYGMHLKLNIECVCC
jgi:hypothetical protein